MTATPIETKRLHTPINTPREHHTCRIIHTGAGVSDSMIPGLTAIHMNAQVANISLEIDL